MMTSNQNAVQRRVTRRIVLAVVLAFVLIGLFGMFSVRGAAFDHLHAAHRLILADTTSRIATKLEQVSDNLASLASEAVVRQFALEGRNVPSALGVREIALSRLVD
ncbi:MAG TPA: hypothetical protein VKY59_18145, partial [Spirillospora sp.]|nr:hypothetical protein [Spirillospora sp.]